MALKLNGKKRNIRRKDFFVFAENCDLTRQAAEKMVKKVCSLKEKYKVECDRSWLSEEQKEAVKELIEERIRILEGCKNI